MKEIKKARSVTFHVNSVPIRADAADLFAHFADRPGLFYQDSGCRVADTGRYSYIGFEPFSTVCFRHGIARITSRHKAYNFATDPFDLIDAGAARFAVEGPVPDLPFVGGAVGYFSYDLGRYVERIGDATFDDLLLPELRWGLYDRIIAIDHTTNIAHVVTSTAGRQEDPVDQAARLAAEVVAVEPGQANPAVLGAAAGSPRANYSREDYQQMVQTAIDYIAAGDLFQVNLAQRFEFPLPGSVTDLYSRLRAASPGDFAAYLDAGDFQILSSSPERFLLRAGRDVETRPIKGTRPRRSAGTDAQTRQELLDSEKDSAELAMIVDLERNDLGRVCEYGSVSVVEPKRVDSYATVHHLSAVVRGTLRSEGTLGQLLRATFPGGSITGAPKVRAMEIIEELEPVRRGVYTGALGYVGWDGRMDLNIAIRTLVAKEGIGYYGAGGGIVYDSDPESEYEETLAKARAVMNVLGDPGD